MKYFSMFSGIGGFELGIGEKGECVGFSEIDKYAIEIYQKHFPKHKKFGDAATINTSELPKFDILTGGFPCQTFSIAGKRMGFKDTRGTLFFEIARVLKDKRPRMFLLENVKGLLSHDERRTLTTILTTLDELGYSCEWQVLNSKNFGAPQNRERVFIIGHLRGECQRQIFPIGEVNKIHIKESTQSKSESKPASTLSTKWRKESNFVIMNKQLKPKRTDNTAACLTGGGHSGGNHSDMDLIQVGNIDQKGHNSLWGRVYDPKGIAANINAEGGGMGAKTGLYDMGLRIRRLTPIECERLQGFPDEWTEGISDTQRYKCLGNAVTVNVIEAIMSEIIRVGF